MSSWKGIEEDSWASAGFIALAVFTSAATAYRNQYDSGLHPLFIYIPSLIALFCFMNANRILMNKGEGATPKKIMFGALGIISLIAALNGHFRWY